MIYIANQTGLKMSTNIFESDELGLMVTRFSHPEGKKFQITISGGEPYTVLTESELKNFIITLSKKLKNDREEYQHNLF